MKKTTINHKPRSQKCLFLLTLSVRKRRQNLRNSVSNANSKLVSRLKKRIND